MSHGDRLMSVQMQQRMNDLSTTEQTHLTFFGGVVDGVVGYCREHLQRFPAGNGYIKLFKSKGILELTPSRSELSALDNLRSDTSIDEVSTCYTCPIRLQEKRTVEKVSSSLCSFPNPVRCFKKELGVASNE